MECVGQLIFELDPYKYLTSLFCIVVWRLGNWELPSKEQSWVRGTGRQGFQPQKKICFPHKRELDKVQKWNLEGLLFLESQGNL